MNCCGGRRASSPAASSASGGQAAQAERWVVESLRDAPITIYGPATGRAYRFMFRGARLDVAASDRLAWRDRSDFAFVDPNAA